MEILDRGLPMELAASAAPPAGRDGDDMDLGRVYGDIPRWMRRAGRDGSGERLDHLASYRLGGDEGLGCHVALV